MHLIIDTSIMGVAVSAYATEPEPKIIWSGISLENARSSLALPTLVTACLKCCASDLSQVESFAVAAGPGSFTGIKVGWSFVQGLSLSHGLPCFPYSAPIEALRFLFSRFDVENLFVPATKTNGFLLRQGAEDLVMITEVAVNDRGVSFKDKDLKPLSGAYPVAHFNGDPDLSQGKSAVLARWDTLKETMTREIGGFWEISDQQMIHFAMEEVARRATKEQSYVDVNCFEPFYLKRSAPEERMENTMEKNR